MSNIIAEFNSTPWAIEPTHYRALICKVTGGKVANLPPLEEAAKKPTLRQTKGRVGIVPIMGTIMHRGNDFMDMFGIAYTSTERLGQQMDSLMADDSVSAIVARIDSNGGMVKNTPETAEKIFNYRGQGKRLIAVADGDMNSAAIYLGAAFDEVYVTPSGSAGSVGVIWEHIDDSEFMESMGVKSEFISYGEHKAEGWGPMTDSLRDRMQEMVNEAGDQFVSDLSRFRGTSTKDVKANYGKGRVLMPKEALAVGMVDGIKTYEEVVNKLIGATPKTSNSVRRKRLALSERIR